MTEPQTLSVNMKRLTPREISIIEEHTGYTAKRWDDDNCPIGKLTEALAYVALRRKDPTRPAKDLWNEAADTIIEMEQDDPDPTLLAGSTAN